MKIKHAKPDTIRIKEKFCFLPYRYKYITYWWEKVYIAERLTNPVLGNPKWITLNVMSDKTKLIGWLEKYHDYCV